MAGDRDDRDSTAPGFIQTDLYGHSFEAQLPDSLTKGSRRRAPALSRRELLKRAGVAGAAAAVPLGLPEAVYGPPVRLKLPKPPLPHLRRHHRRHSRR